MNRSRALTPALVLAALAACDGRTKVGESDLSARPVLQSVDLGRLVDVYAYRRTDQTIGDRRLRASRRIELVKKNVVINSGVESQTLFDAAGGVQPSANYEFLPFDKTVGHEELVILWDDTVGGPEEANFKTALANAETGLTTLAPAYRGQNTATRPIPIVPRNAAIRLKFSNRLDFTNDFFTVNPSVLQLLEFKGDPDTVEPVNAFRVLPYRVVPNGDSIILDTTILAGEAVGSSQSSGLPLSADNFTANIRIAIPARGGVVPTFYVREDEVTELNDVDSAGRASVIRDFRSGNLADGAAGRLREPEAPMIVGAFGMGITEVDTADNVLTINKREQFVPVRGRYPFVDGPLGPGNVPTGPLTVPVASPLAHGDIVTQTIQVQNARGELETLTLRAEVLQNLDVASTVGEPNLGFAFDPGPGDSGQGEKRTVARVRVASVFAGVDSTGVRHAFQANATPLGNDCVVRAIYCEELPFTGGSVSLTDRPWRNLFLRIEPKPTQAAVDVLPNASVAIEFTKPMDLDQVDPTANLVITSKPVPTETFEQQMAAPKRATSRVVPTRLSDLAGDGTVLRLQPPMGFFHLAGSTEFYAFNVKLGAAGVTDLAGNALRLFDNPANPATSWSVDFSMAPSAIDNRVLWHAWLFEDDDEDGTLPGSVDIFGQFRRENGRLFAASSVRFGRSADSQNLGSISRINRGECWDGREQIPGTPPPPNPPPVPNPTSDVQFFPLLPVDQAGASHPGNLYWQPQMFDSVAPPNVPAVYEYWQLLPQPVGRVVEPLKPQGSRMQMRYLEDDFSLSYRQPTDLGLDVEQLYWSPFNDETVLYDVFDRFTMSLSHSRVRPDEFWFLNTTPVPPECTLACASMNSSLSLTFSDNVLEGTSQVPVFEDKLYTINPNEAFLVQSIRYVPFPRFDRTYTWRDSRLVSIDAAGNIIGLGGAQQPGAQPPANDFTANIDSPWIKSNPTAFEPAPPPGGPQPDPEFFGLGNTIWVLDPADFLGNLQRDHDPIALPLLVDFKVFPDDAANGVANGNNGFQVALLGPPSYGFPLYGGYYDQASAQCGTPAWPRTRVHASGGFDLITGAAILVDPANTLQAAASVAKDAGALAFGGSAATALMNIPAGDGMLNWARADFVRKVSTMTFGFVDTLQPQIAVMVDPTSGAAVPEEGFPNLATVAPDMRIADLVVQLDPPQARQPAGTSVVVELRGADTFARSDRLYNPEFAGGPSFPASDLFDTRGNLLNPNYACEAYRYSTANTALGARVPATGLTPYVTEDQLNQIRNPVTQLLPRFLNPRLVMTNNVDVTPPLSPSLRSMTVVYRVQ